MTRYATRHGVPVLCAALVAVAGMVFGCSCEKEPAVPAFVESAVWDDGLAEVATYQAVATVDGEARPHAVTQVVAKQALDAQTLVQADTIDESRVVLPAFKFARIATVPAPDFPNHLLLTAFVVRQYPRQLVKLTVGSQDGYGTTYQEVVVGERPEYTFRSYLDGLGEGTVGLAVQEGDLFEDALPVALRSLAFRAGDTFTARLWPSLLGATPINPEPLETAFDVAEERIEIPAGKYRAWRVTAKNERGVWRYWFDQEGLGVLLKAETPGDTLEMMSTTRAAYGKAPAASPETVEETQATAGEEAEAVVEPEAEEEKAEPAPAAVVEEANEDNEVEPAAEQEAPAEATGAGEEAAPEAAEAPAAATDDKASAPAEECDEGCCG